jgi:hypothetical protein
MKWRCSFDEVEVADENKRKNKKKEKRKKKKASLVHLLCEKHDHMEKMEAVI